MREEIIRCDECKGVVDGEVLNLHGMIVRLVNRKQEADEEIMIAGTLSAEKNKRPDFCGIPCMFKWITNKINGGTKGGDTNGLT